MSGGEHCCCLIAGARKTANEYRRADINLLNCINTEQVHEQGLQISMDEKMQGHASRMIDESRIAARTWRHASRRLRSVLSPRRVAPMK
jgi:hypothetical protein